MVICRACYNARNIGFVLGIFLLLAAKVATPYMGKDQSPLPATTTAIPVAAQQARQP
jgi:hypothetical protein